ncbi:magnesium transporter MRS2-3-like [Trifolium pratense]|uniref:magnesium transporter MRS2-3-like n=1 Tax=Trifolium pratense TaxID=57577 RepID=UPI001E6901AF|nr:magnesium transporter MRS2-3-like [Trifolium pratense]
MMGEERVARRQIGRKGSMARTWLMMSSEGQRQMVEAGRQSIMRRTGLTARDLRNLDPMLSYPSTIVGRDKAMVLNLEQIKAIITAHEVLLLNSRDPSVIPFVDELHARILNHHCTAPTTDHPQEGQNGKDRSEIKRDSSNNVKILPFEFVVLESCLEAVISSLENEANILELEAFPALDKLTSKISTLNLERVRHIKSRLVALTSRVQRVRDQLENLLDDDGDMAELYLTDKLAQQQFEIFSAASSINNNGDDMTANQVLQQDIVDRTHPEISLEPVEDLIDGEDYENVGGEISGTQAATVYSGVPNVQELEMLLGAYFVQIGATLNKLSALAEYVEDTEDYINITLDDKQNRILQAGVQIGTASVIVNFFVVVTGIFGMNIHIDLFEAKANSAFLETVFGCTATCIILYFLAMFWYKKRRIL